MPERLRPWWFPLGVLALLEWYARVVAPTSDTLAPPSAALRALLAAGGDGSLWSFTGFTLASAGAGLAVGGGLGLLLGIALGLSRRAADAAFLSVEVLRPIPSIALVPLSMLVFGFGLGMELAVVAFACFWPLLVLTQAAVRQVDPVLLEVARALQLPPLRRVVWVVLPAVLPRLFVALRLGVSVALVVAVTVEIAANPHGMGYAMMLAQQSLDPALTLGWLFWIGVIGYAINAGALRLQRAVARRMGGAPA